MSDFGVILENITEIGDIESFNKEDLLKYPPYSNNALKTYPPNDYVLIDDIQRINESSKVRCIGMTFETRPDYCKEPHVDRMLNMGVTRVELGVQTIHNHIYEKIKRGHTVEDVIEANRILRDSGVKVAMHMMPGLFPLARDEPRIEQCPEKDLEMFKTIFTNENFKPDMLKIYPCLVTDGSELHKLWKEGKYRPYSDEEAVELIVQIKKILPKWVRTMRIQRDIPSTLIEDGVKKSNLGELVYNRLEEEKINCQCIRCREIGHKKTKEEYSRMPSEKAHREEIDNKTAIVRELHVYGNMIKIGQKGSDIGQHTGFGEKLLKRAEEISIDQNKEELLIISGIGARNYYRKFGYERKGPYMAKKLV